MNKIAPNNTPLNIVSLFKRAADFFGEKKCYEYGTLSKTWRDVYMRSKKVASALKSLGIKEGETISLLLPNVPAMLEAHFFIPLFGGVINPINFRLEEDTIIYILEHSQTRVLFYDEEYSEKIKKILSKISFPIECICVKDSQAFESSKYDSNHIEYEDFLNSSNDNFDGYVLKDENLPISINYTSGTTGEPKGVIYHHRGAFLNAINNAFVWKMTDFCTYLWTLPLFHCNGWCFVWSLASLAGNSILLRKVDSKKIFDIIEEKKVSYFCGAPIIPTLLINTPKEQTKIFSHPVYLMAAGGAHPTINIKKLASYNIHTTLAYGLTETFGPAVYCAWKPEWSFEGEKRQDFYYSRAGIRYHSLDFLEVVDIKTNEILPHDGKSVGEVVFRGNLVMSGYYRDKEKTNEAFRGGFFHSGDLGIIHPDGYLQITDRLKDIIVSGGENISSLEIEACVMKYSGVAEVAVIGISHKKWGETPCAFVKTKNKNITQKEIIDFCRNSLAHYKCPTRVIFIEKLPINTTGKIQKFVLREDFRRKYYNLK